MKSLMPTIATVVGLAVGKWLSNDGWGRRLATIAGAGDPWLYFLYSFFLMIGSGTFSGLILALLSQSEKELEELIKGSNAKKAAAARKVLPLRKTDNWLLCTLLFINVGLNASMTTIIDAQLVQFLGHQVVGIVLTTVIIFFFGELTPQAICNAYGLEIGARFVPMVWVVMYLFAPVCWPIGKALDWALHESDEEQSNLLTNHAMSTLSERAGVERKSSQLKDLVKPLSKSFTLSEEDVLNDETLNAIKRCGQAVVPVKSHKASSDVVALLMTSDLIGVQPQAQKPLKQLLKAFSA